MHTRTALVAAAWVALSGCLMPRPISQTTITQLREQDAIVMAPESPMGMGPSLVQGASSLALGAGFTALQPVLGDDVGQTVIPVSGLLRGAAAADDNVEVVASGSIGSVDLNLGPVSQPIDGVSGILGRGALGFRAFIPFESAVEWGFSMDIGAEASHLARTDTTTIATRDRAGQTESQSAVRNYWLRLHPHLRTGTVIRAPIAAGLPLTAMGGLQLQTWPAYWGSRVQTDTCTTYRGGEVECETQGNVDVRPSKLVAVFTPTLGATIHSGSVLVHVQAYVNVGNEPVTAVPWGAMVMLERLARQE